MNPNTARLLLWLSEWRRDHDDQTVIYGFGTKAEPLDLTADMILGALDEVWDNAAHHGVYRGHTAGNPWKAA